jgi:hypothetical protein
VIILTKGITRKAIFVILLIAIVLSLLGTFTLLESSSTPTAKVIEKQPDDGANIKIYIEPENEEEEEMNGGNIK